MKDLNLNDPSVVEKLKLADVMAKKESTEEELETVKAEEKIKKLRKEASFTIKLDLDSISVLERAASESGLATWKDYLTKEIHEKILGGKVASPKIARPSWAKPVNKITSKRFK